MAAIIDGLPAGAKLLALGALGVITIMLAGPLPAVGVLAAVILTAIAARLPLRSTLRGMLPVVITAVGVGIYQWWTRGASTAIEIAAELLALVLAAAVVTATTPADRLLDTVARAARPLRLIGIHPDTAALAVSLTLRTLPEIARTVSQVREAARARGLERNPRVWLTPAVLRVVGRARDLGEALAARGIAD